ncbi:MAG: ribonuclease D [Bacteroidota bacterium]
MKTLLVASPADFDRAIQYLKGSQEIAIDLEFDNNRYTYGLNLCLIQIADRSHCFIIDPVAIRQLRPLWDILENPQITKIFHCANSDILLLKMLGCQPRNILDTEVAVKILNYQKTSLAQALLVNLGLDLDKSLQVSNWNTRPLTPEQLLYAAADVIYLHDLKDRLLVELQQLQRLHWLEEECRLLELIENRDNPDPHMKLRETNRLTAYQQFVLKALFSFRDELGRQFNKPSAFIIPNDTLVALAVKPVTNLDEWSSLKGFFRQIKDRHYFQRFQKTIQDARQLADEQNIPHRLPPSFRRPQSSLSEAEVERRRQIGTTLRKALLERYGEITASLVLGQTAINEFCQGGSLFIRKNYALEIVRQLAEELNIDLATLPLESSVPAD